MSSFLNRFLFLKTPYTGLSSILSDLGKYMYILNATPLILNVVDKNVTSAIIENTKTNAPSFETKLDECLEKSNEVEICDQEPPVPSVPTSFHAPSILPKIQNDYISPKLPDSLFWCIYIAANGYDEYLEIHRNYGVKELEIKKNVADMVKETPSVFKLTNYKMTKVSIQEILSELLTSQKETSMISLIAIIIFYKVNIVLLNPTTKCVLELISNKDSELPYYVLIKEELSKEDIEVRKEEWFCLESYLKPLKPISSYKAEELITISKKLAIHDSEEKLKKPELYEKISEYAKWK
jgi:hypothetical protein